MDDQRFDRLTRTFAASHSRRQALGLLSSLVAAAALPWRSVAAQETTPACDSGLTYCADAGACVDLLSDLNHCGACGSICESQLVPVACRDGECVRANCAEGQEYCGAVDGCRDLSSDPAHCGACANACASGVCTGGVCGPGGGACAPGQLECDGICVDACCNNDHCGACGNACTPPFTCFEAVCDCPSGLCCAEGEVVCGGACVATCCDNNNCGVCGNVCTGGLTCFEGQCDCPSGNCPPVQLPDTGTGSTRAVAGADPWALMAAISAAALAVSARTRTGQQAED